MSDWQWRCGALVGYGESAWQEKDGKIRRITIIMPKPTGGAVMMIPISLRFMEGKVDLVEFDAKGLVAASKEPTAGFTADLERHWGRTGVVAATQGDVPRGPRIIV